MHCVDLGDSFQTHIYLQNLASIQPKTSPLKFAGSDAVGRRRRRPEVAKRLGRNGEVEQDRKEVLAVSAGNICGPDRSQQRQDHDLPYLSKTSKIVPKCFGNYPAAPLSQPRQLKSSRSTSSRPRSPDSPCWPPHGCGDARLRTTGRRMK